MFANIASLKWYPARPVSVRLCKKRVILPVLVLENRGQIRKHSPDAIGLQEVRSFSYASSAAANAESTTEQQPNSDDDENSQLAELQVLLPEYKYSAFRWTESNEIVGGNNEAVGRCCFFAVLPFF